MELSKYLIMHNHKLIQICVIPKELKEQILKWYINRKGYTIIEKKTRLNK